MLTDSVQFVRSVLRHTIVILGTGKGVGQSSFSLQCHPVYMIFQPFKWLV